MATGQIDHFTNIFSLVTLNFDLHFDWNRGKISHYAKYLK